MTLKEELEILRGEPIGLRTRPEDVPCVETSDPERLCKHPVVSVHMITYNHEPYIRQAIEGVMMQKTDFEFELVIGEDASQDKTREICFEYQKRYPDKIRVLWSEHNVNDVGGNPTRVTARCRGEFIAFCEGDDYWIDPLKLQKQVEVMRRYPRVGLCFGSAEIMDEVNLKSRIWNSAGYWHDGQICGGDFLARLGYGLPEGGVDSDFIMTATVMLKRKVLLKAKELFPILQWRLYLADLPTWMALASLSDVYFLDCKVSVYRRVSTGAATRNATRVGFDASLVRLWFWVELCNDYNFPTGLVASILYAWLYDVCQQHNRFGYVDQLSKMSNLASVFLDWRLGVVIWFRSLLGTSEFVRRISGKYLWGVYPIICLKKHVVFPVFQKGGLGILC